jgi:hypothetical protein
MKKSLPILFAFLFLILCSPTGNTNAEEIIETGKEVEIKEYAPKMFIYEALHPWVGFDTSDFYLKKYHARKSVEMEGPKRENIRIWIKIIKSGETNFTHVITIFLPYEKVMIDGKKQMKAADRLTYAVNANQLAFCPNSDPNNKKSIKLIRYYHKAIPK